MVNKYFRETILIEIKMIHLIQMVKKMMLQKILSKEKIVLKNKTKVLQFENNKKMQYQNKIIKKKRKPN